MAQLVRAPPCHGGGRGFESHPGRLHRRPKILCDFFLKYHKLTGILAQLGEHLPYKQRVTGSSPVGPTILKRMVFADVLVILADVAQLAEQLICNQQVIGSSPIIGL